MRHKTILKICLLSFIMISAVFLTSCTKSENNKENNYKLKTSEEYIEDVVDLSNFKSKIKFDSKSIKLSNKLYSKNNIIYAELKDICDNFDLKLNYDNEMDYEISIEKYESKIELKLNTNYAIKRIPGGVSRVTLDGYTFIKEDKVYISLYDILKFFHYNVSYDEMEDSIIIKNNDNRMQATAEDVYVNIINSYLELEKAEIEAQTTYDFKYTQHLKNYLNLDGNIKYKFVFHDYTNDGTPELLLYYQNQNNNEERGVSGWIMYKYNENTHMLEKFQISEDTNLFSYVFGYDMQNRLYKIVYDNDNIFTQCYEWNEKDGFVLLDRKDGVIDDCVIRFDGITSEYMKKNNISAKNVIASNTGEEMVMKNLKVLVDDKEVLFNENFPVKKKGIILLPTKEIFELMGYKVSWLSNGEPVKLKVGNADAGTHITKDNVSIFVPQFGKGDTITVNKTKQIKPEMPLQNINGNSYLSTGAITEASGVNLIFDKDSNEINIKTKN